MDFGNLELFTADPGFWHRCYMRNATAIPSEMLIEVSWVEDPGFRV